MGCIQPCSRKEGVASVPVPSRDEPPLVGGVLGSTPLADGVLAA